MPNVYLIIVTYNAMKWADRCFSSLRKSTVPIRCIVVDNGSTDGTQDYITGNFPEAQLIQSPENLGFGKANNRGIEIAYRQGADFFYLMNQDAWIYEDSIEKLLDAYNMYPNHEEIGLLSPMHLDGSEEKLDRHFENYLAKNSYNSRILSAFFFGKIKQTYEVDFVNAAHWFLPKKTVVETGGFNPYFFHGAEDYDYVNRVLFRRRKVLVCPDSRVVHDAKQHYDLQDPDAAYAAKWESLRMQKETLFMDPKYAFNPVKEKKKLKRDLLKFTIKGYTKERLQQKKMLDYLLPKMDEISKYRNIILNSPHPFLTI